MGRMFAMRNPLIDNLIGYFLLYFFILISWYLWIVAQVRPKFLQCVAATCFFIASKLEEQPEVSHCVLGERKCVE